MGPFLLGNFAVAMLARVPIGFALAAASLLTLWLVTDVPLTIGGQRILAGMTSFPLLAIPLFVLAGAIMNAGGITRRLLDLADALVGGMRGGLAQANVMSSLFFGGISGSAIADISSLGRILIPAMKERNYRAAYAAVVTAASPVVSPIMPPSITLIVYGVASGTSIGALFFAGILPAFLYIALLMITVHLTVQKQGFTAEAMQAAPDMRNIGKVAREDRPKFWISLYRALPALLLPVLILAGIRFGWFTATEAAAMAVVYALVVGLLIYREITLKKIVYALTDSALVVGLIMLVLAAAQLYSWALTSGRVPEAMADAIFAVSENPVILLLLMNLLLIVIGMFIEANAALIILTPILLPLAVSIGVDPVHLGIIIIANLGIGLLTPPVGIALMLSAELGKVSMVSAIRAAWPFLLAGLAFILVVTFVPEVSMWLPTLLMP
ncbi:TRAP transporter large permease [Microbacterium sp. HA-8]|uniref:TRAP transporter large permease n=1 Tax=Microbacterium sp. HA-8 TaxID=3234200 RepID=UPI0038F69AA0